MSERTFDFIEVLECARQTMNPRELYNLFDWTSRLYEQHLVGRGAYEEIRDYILKEKFPQVNALREERKRLIKKGV